MTTSRRSGLFRFNSWSVSKLVSIKNICISNLTLLSLHCYFSSHVYYSSCFICSPDVNNPIHTLSLSVFQNHRFEIYTIWNLHAGFALWWLLHSYYGDRELSSLKQNTLHQGSGDQTCMPPVPSSTPPSNTTHLMTSLLLTTLTVYPSPTIAIRPYYPDLKAILNSI